MAKERGEGIGATVLGQLPQEKWDELARAVEDLVVAPGTVIFRQGDPGDKFYLIRTGRVRVFREDAGLETELSVLQAGDDFGEMALFMDEPRSATVAALEETRLMVLSKEQFQSILKDFPNVTFAFVRQMSERLLRNANVIRRGR
jgi:CRP-like cAMP-binding protein